MIKTLWISTHSCEDAGRLYLNIYTSGNSWYLSRTFPSGKVTHLSPREAQLTTENGGMQWLIDTVKIVKENWNDYPEMTKIGFFDALSDNKEK